MKSTMSLLGIVLVTALVANPVIAQESDEQSERVKHMHEHLDYLTAIKAAILIGDLDATREPATWLAEHEPLDDLPVEYEPFVLLMRNHAQDIVEADDVVTAAVGMARIANDCASCHLAFGLNLRFGFDKRPSEYADLQSHMQRHLWAVDRLWEGLIGPSDTSWSRGVSMMAEAPQLGTHPTWDDEATGGDALASEIHRLGRDAAKALTPYARSQVYGEMIGVCAECHKRTGGGPRASVGQ